MAKYEAYGTGEFRQLRAAIMKEAASPQADPRWSALQERLPPEGYGLHPRELIDLRREYEYTKAMATGMIGRVLRYQMTILTSLLLLGLMTYLANGYVLHPAPPLKLALGGYFGAIGASAGSLWGLIRHTTSRSLRFSLLHGHYLKPILGAVMGVLVMLLLPSVGGFGEPTVAAGQNVIPAFTPVESTDSAAEASDSAPPATTVPMGGSSNALYALAALAGLFEQSFMKKFQAITDAVLGTGPQAPPPATAVAAEPAPEQGASDGDGEPAQGRAAKSEAKPALPDETRPQPVPEAQIAAAAEGQIEQGRSLL